MYSLYGIRIFFEFLMEMGMGWLEACTQERVLVASVRMCTVRGKLINILAILVRKF